jgi:hypothetical protein
MIVNPGNKQIRFTNNFRRNNSMALLIQNAIFNYVHIKTPVLEYQAKPDPEKAYMFKEYIVDTLMPYASWKKFKKHYKKVGAIEKAKTFTAAEYEAAFKVAPPTDEMYQDDDGEFTLIKFRQRAYYKNSEEPTKQPRVLGTKKILNGNGDAIGFKDNLDNEVSTDISVGNGSLGVLQFRERNWEFGGKPGLSLDLVKIQIKELIPFAGSDDNDDDFDMEESQEEGSNPFGGGGDLGGEEEKEEAPKPSGSAGQEPDDSGVGW